MAILINLKLTNGHNVPIIWKAGHPHIINYHKCFKILYTDIFLEKAFLLLTGGNAAFQIVSILSYLHTKKIRSGA